MLPSIFELTVESTTAEDEYRLVAEWSRAGSLPLRSERHFSVDHTTLRGRVEARAYGEALGRMLFVDGIRELFVRARSDPSELRVLLAVEAKALRSLRWERLAAPFGADHWILLGHSQPTPFSLYLPSTTDRRFPPFGRRDLRALVVVASPNPDNRYGVDPFDEATAIETVLEGLGTIPSTVLGKAPGAEGPPTLQELSRRLTTERYTLMHWICHGAFSSRTGETAVFLDGADGKTTAVKATTIVERFRELGTTRGLPHFAFLVACDSAKPEAEDALGGLGQRLVRELGMPAVVAMTQRVSQSTALTLGTGLYSRLWEHGEVDRALVEACVEVRGRDDSVVPALFSRLAGRPLFSDELDRPLTAIELAATAEQLDALFVERAPVLRARARTLAAAVTVDPSVLTGDAAREHGQSLVELEHLCQSVLELSFSALGHGREPPPYNVRCSFPGMRPFTAEQREFFRGRERLVHALTRQLEQRSFLAVLGSSGCGKSSLVMAGVVPRLRERSPGLLVTTLQPGAHPQAKLREELAGLAGLAGLGETVDSVLYVDQFEEVFTLCRDQIERKQFIEQLLASVSPRRKVIISMRADFIGECAQYETLRQQIAGLQLVPPMSANELRNAVQEQGKAAGLRYETGLCELLLEDLADEPGAMPLLQHALRQLYDRRHGRWLRVQAYEEIGRVQRAITQTAESVWDQLDEADHQRLCSIMLELTEVREPEGGGPARYLRRRVPLSSLYSTGATTRSPLSSMSTSLEQAAIMRLVDLLADDRLLVKSRDATMGDVVEVAHEALLRSWERLQDWLAEARESIRLRQDMEQATARWRATNRSPAYLEHMGERGDRVRSFLRDDMLRLDVRLREYFDACEAEERRQREDKERQQQEKLEASQRLAQEQSRRVRQLRRSLTTIAAMGLLAAAAAVVAFSLYGVAETEKKNAEVARDEAEVARDEAEVARDDARAAHEATDQALERQKGLTAELMADQPGRRAEAVFQAIELAKPSPLDTDSLPIETRRAIYGATRGLHAARELMHSDGLPVVDLAFSPDSQRLATASRDHTAKIWSVVSAELLATLSGHEDDVQSVAFVPAGDTRDPQLITVGMDGKTRLWAADGTPLDFIEPMGHVVAAIFSPDRRQLATASRAGLVTLWTRGFMTLEATPVLDDLNSPVTHLVYAASGLRLLVVHADGTARILDAGAEPIREIELRGHEAAISAVVASPDGTRFITGDKEGSTLVWDAERGTEEAAYRGTGMVQQIAISPDGRRVAVALERLVELWNIRQREKVATLRGHRANVRDVAFSPEGRRLATVSRDKAVRLWSADSGAALGVLDGHTEPIVRVNYSPDGQTIATADESGTVRLWQAHCGTEELLLPGHGAEVRRMALSSDGSWVAMATAQSTTLSNLSTGEVITLDLESPARAMAWAPDGTRIVIATEDRVSAAYDTTTGAVIDELATHDAMIHSIEFSPEGRLVATGDSRGVVRLFRSGSYEAFEEPMRAHRYGVLDLEFSPDGTRLATGGMDMRATVWDLSRLGREPTATLEHAKPVLQVVFAPDGKHIATGDSIGGVRFWTLETGEFVELSGNLATVRAIAFSPDGRQLLTAGIDAAVRLWDLDTREELYTLGTHTRKVISARFVDGGRRAITGSIDGAVLRWVVDSRERLYFACRAIKGIMVDRAEVEALCRSVLVAPPLRPRSISR
ncbi:MAG: CHAT domain-containing protein [Myxococcota bacterium]